MGAIATNVASLPTVAPDPTNLPAEEPATCLVCGKPADPLVGICTTCMAPAPTIETATVNFTAFYCDTAAAAATVRKRVTLDEHGQRVVLDPEGFWNGVAKSLTTSMSEFGGRLAGEPEQTFAFYVAGVNPRSPLRMGSCDGVEQSRSTDAFPFPKQDALLVVDSDTVEHWGLREPEDVVAVIQELCLHADCVTASSGSSYLETPTENRGLRGLHTFFSIDNGTEIPRVLEVLHKRAWLAGYGRILVGENGVLHVRSIIDLAMRSSNQPVFEFGAILLDDRIKQRRQVAFHAGATRQIRAADIVNLTDVEEAEYQRLVAAAKEAKAAKAAAVRARWLDGRVAHLPVQARHAARERLEDQCEKQHRDLTPDDIVALNDNSTITVAQLVAEAKADPKKWDRRGIRDPWEPMYGRSKATVVVNGQTDGRIKILSRAHGVDVTYHLEPRPDALADFGVVVDVAEVITALRSKPREEVVESWARIAAALPIADGECVLEAVKHLTGMGARPLRAALNEARRELEDEVQRERIAQRVGERKEIAFDNTRQVAAAQEIEKQIIARSNAIDYFQYAGAPAEVVEKESPYCHATNDPDAPPPKVPSISLIDRVGMLARAEAVATLIVGGRRGPQAIAMQPNVIDVLLNQRSSAAAPVVGLVTHPLVLPDGEIVAADGLHARSRLIFSGAAVADCRPYSKSEARAAVARLRRDYLAGFEFATPLDELGALALLLTAVLRKVLDAAPGGAITANVQSSGKTTLARVKHYILTGRDLPVSPFPASEEELQKTLLAMLIPSPAVICFDNVGDGFKVSSPTLSQAITSNTLRQRILGESRDVEVPTAVLITLTGNNLRLGVDETTRWIEVRLEAKTARPEERKFVHPDVAAHALAIRVQVLRDVVGIVAGYIASGEHAEISTRFPAWDRMVRQPLVWAGAGDIADSFRRNGQTSEEVSALIDLIRALDKAFGAREFQAGEIVARVDDEACGDGGLEAAMSGVHVRDPRSAPSVGRLLKKFDRRRVSVDGTVRWLAGEVDSGGRTRYRLERDG
jgi:hypothetical protein